MTYDESLYLEASMLVIDGLVSVMESDSDGQISEKIVPISKNDLADPRILTMLDRKIKRDKDMKYAKLVFKALTSLGSIALCRIVNSHIDNPILSLLSSLLISSAMCTTVSILKERDDKKHREEYVKMLSAVTAKIAEFSADYVKTEDENDKKIIKEYLKSLSIVKHKLQNAIVSY